MHMIGGFWGGEMTSLVYEGHLVTKLEGWGEGSNGITGLRVTHSNGKVNFSSHGSSMISVRRYCHVGNIS